MRPRVAVVYDTDGWSFHNIAIQIQRSLGADYEIEIFPYQKVSDEHKAFLLETDALICLWYGALQKFQQGRPEHAPWQDRLVPERCKMIACVFDEVLRWNSDKARASLAHACETADLILLACEGMAKRIFPELPTPKRIGFCQDGVDLSLFPARMPRHDLRSSPLRVGWIGNSGSEYFGTIKGLAQIKEACLGLDGVRLLYHDRAEHGLIPHDQMSQSYEEIDVQICFSACEGTPNPILEASATGRPWISTAVGIVPEMMREARLRGMSTPPGLIIPREVPMLRRAIEILRDDRDLVVRMGEAALEIAQRRWTWEQRISCYRHALQMVGVTP